MWDFRIETAAVVRGTTVTPLASEMIRWWQWAGGRMTGSGMN